MKKEDQVFALFGLGGVFALIACILISVGMTMSKNKKQTKTYQNINIAFGVFTCLTITTSGIATMLQDSIKTTIV